MCTTLCTSIILFPLRYVFPIHMEDAHARKTTQWRKVKCEVSGAREGLAGGEKVSGVLPAKNPCFIRSAGWAADKTTRDGHFSQVVWRTNMHGPEHPPPHPQTTISLAQGQSDGYKKRNCQRNDHNSTVIQILFSGCRVNLLHQSLAPSQNALLRWHLPSTSTPQLCRPTVTNTPGFSWLICMQYLAHMVHFRDRYF